VRESEFTNDENQILKKIFIFLRLNKSRTMLNSYLPKNRQQTTYNDKLTNLEITELKKLYLQTKELVEQNNSKFYFVYLPQFARYKTNYDDKNYNMLKNMMNELKIPFIDIHTELLALEQNPLKLFPFESPGHYNVNGYKKIAETIHNLIKN
jgi:lysophospholipase L1-like esterase